MTLSSLHFIFIFLPIFLLLYYILPKSWWRNALLVIGSLFFFGWSDPRNLPLLLLALVVNFTLGYLIHLVIDKKSRQAAQPLMWIAIIINLSLLIFYKYSGFLIQSAADLFNRSIEFENPVLPVGISFFTFTGIAYILDIYNSAEKAEKNIVRFSSYFLMFPKLLQGPITRFGTVKNGLINPHPTVDEILEGIRRFIGGLAKKVLLADQLGIAVNKVFSAEFDAIGANVAWFGLLAYTLQIYLDFSGYTDMAIGLGKCWGLTFPKTSIFRISAATSVTSGGAGTCPLRAGFAHTFSSLWSSHASVKNSCVSNPIS